ncbi:MAG: hypothetical protein ACJ8AQ_10440, partial [Gemmatimonadales bacterium]
MISQPVLALNVHKRFRPTGSRHGTIGGHEWDALEFATGPQRSGTGSVPDSVLAGVPPVCRIEQMPD